MIHAGRFWPLSQELHLISEYQHCPAVQTYQGDMATARPPWGDVRGLASVPGVLVMQTINSFRHKGRQVFVGACQSHCGSIG